MRLDRTHVRIRERNVLEILDLAQQIVRVHWRPLFILLVIGAAPWALVDHWLCGWLDDPMANGFESAGMFQWHMFLLVLFQAPLGTAVITAYLGHAVFDERPSLARIVGDVARGWSKLAIAFLLIRGAGLLMLVFLWAKLAQGDVSAWRVLATVGLVVVGSLVQLFRPFVSEIVVLEQPPWISNDERIPSFRQRSGQMHGAAAGVVFGRGFFVSIAGLVLLWAIYGGVATVYGTLQHDWYPHRWMVTIIWPVALWLTAGFLAVTRFVNYLDIRIRQEGWEVELLLRAEGQKLAESLV